VSTDADGYASVNPLFMKYAPRINANGKREFAGQGTYGVRSLENFVDACRAINAGMASPADFDDGSMATIHTTHQGTAILAAGRRSLDLGGRPIDIVYESEESIEPIQLVPHVYE
jgi:D-galacturonate reductase